MTCLRTAHAGSRLRGKNTTPYSTAVIIAMEENNERFIMSQLQLSDHLKDRLLNLANEYGNQRSHGTAMPYVFQIKHKVARYHFDRGHDAPDNSEVYVYDDTEYHVLGEWVAERRKDMAEEFSNISHENPEDQLSEIDDIIESHFDNVEICYCYYVEEIYDKCGVFFSEETAQKFITDNRHHLGKDPRTYAIHAWRNDDIALITSVLKHLFDHNKPEICP